MNRTLICGFVSLSFLHCYYPFILKSFVRLALSLGTLVVLIWIENRRPLRRSTEPKIEHNIRNLAIAGVSAVIIQGIESPLVQPFDPLGRCAQMGTCAVRIHARTVATGDSCSKRAERGRRSERKARPNGDTETMLPTLSRCS